MIKVFVEKAEAEKTANKMRSSGWGNARIINVNGDYAIMVHAADCTCGCCPVLNLDGYVGA